MQIRIGVRTLFLWDKADNWNTEKSDLPCSDFPYCSSASCIGQVYAPAVNFENLTHSLYWVFLAAEAVLHSTRNCENRRACESNCSQTAPGFLKFTVLFHRVQERFLVIFFDPLRFSWFHLLQHPSPFPHEKLCRQIIMVEITKILGKLLGWIQMYSFSSKNLYTLPEESATAWKGSGCWGNYSCLYPGNLFILD